MASAQPPSKQAAAPQRRKPVRFNIGPKAKNELRRALRNAEDPPATIQAFRQSQSLHSMMARAFGTETMYGSKNDNGNDTDAVVEPLETDSVLSFLSHLGVSQHEVHKRVSDTLLKQLEDEIRKTSSEKTLLDLLQNCWAYVTTVPELRPILGAVLRQLGEQTPVLMLNALVERDGDNKLKYGEIFRPLPPLLHRLCWQADWDQRVAASDGADPAKFLSETLSSTLLYETLSPHIEEYCGNETLVSAANLTFVATIRERRLPTLQRRALTNTSASKQPGATSTTTGNSSAASFLRKAVQPGTQATQQNTSLWTCGKSIARIRSLLSDTAGTHLSYRPSILSAFLTILMTRHAASPVSYMGGSDHLHCTLVADVLLSAGGSLPQAYQNLLNLARVLDELVQKGNVTNDELVKIQDSVKLIFQSDQDEDDNLMKGSAHANDDAAAVALETTARQHATQRQLGNIISAGLNAMKDADPQNLFLNPVTDAIAPGYSNIITKPICIIEMEGKVANQAYTNLDGWEADVKLMFQNCVDYNRGNAGKWFRGEANRQLRVFREEVLSQAKKLYIKETATASRKRKPEEDNAASLAPLLSSAKRRKRRKKKKGTLEAPQEEVPSMPALASMLLSDPFVVRILVARVLRDLQRGVIEGTSLPVAHEAVPSILQLLHIALWSSATCAGQGEKYFVPGSGSSSPPQDVDSKVGLLPFVSLRQHVPLILRILLENEIDRRISQRGGDLYPATQASPTSLETVASDAWESSSETNDVPTTLIQGLIVHTVLTGKGNEASLASAFTKLVAAMSQLKPNIANNRVFLSCLTSALVKFKGKLPTDVRDAVTDAWLGWMKRAGDSGESIQELFIQLLCEWSSFGTSLLPRDKLFDLSVGVTQAAPKETFASWWDKSATLKGVFERMFTFLTPDRVVEWETTVGVMMKSTEQTDDSPDNNEAVAMETRMEDKQDVVAMDVDA